MSRLQEIDHLLTKCAEELKPSADHVSDVATVRGFIDDLLDERNKIAGVPMIHQSVTRPCTICYRPLKVKVIQPDPLVRGVPVEFTNCEYCDRMKCSCGVYVYDLKIKTCSKGHSLDMETQQRMNREKRSNGLT